MFCVTVVSGLWETGEAAQLQYHAAATVGRLCRGAVHFL